MKKVKFWITALLCLCLLSALCGCAEPGTTPEAAPETTQALKLSAGAGHAELNGAALGSVYLHDGVRYLSVKELDAALALRPAETEDGLQIRAGERTLKLQQGASEAVNELGERSALGGPVLRSGEDWFLPAEALSGLWELCLAYDAQAETLRCYTLEPGPALRLNGTALEGCRLCGDTALLPAEAFSALTERMEEAEQDGAAVLTLQSGGSSLRFREGALTAELDGRALALPVPALREKGSWLLPLEAAAEALGCSLFREEASGSLELLRTEPGAPFWFAGTGFDHALVLNGVSCGSLHGLAEALGCELRLESDAAVLKDGEHELVFRRSQAEAELDGAALALPCPAFPMGEDWLAPLAPVAEAFGLRLQSTPEDGGQVYSRLTPCDTVVYVDGRQSECFTSPEGGKYLRLSDLGRAAGGSMALNTNEAELTAWGREARLTGGAKQAEVDGKALELTLPAAAEGSDWYVPLELLPALGLSELQDPELDQLYYTRIVRHEDLAEGYRVPVLMYHAVSDSNVWGIPELFVSPVTLEQQIQAMLEAGYTAITFEDLDRIDEIEKPVMLTFDDGYDDNYTELFPLLQKYQVKATVFMIVNDIGKNHKLTEEQIKEMSDSGLVSIQSHTLSHGYLDEMYESQLHREHRDSMIALARITGKQPFVMCYPTGRSSGSTREITAQYYEYGLCMGGPCWVTGDAPYRIYRYYISRYTSVDSFLSYLAE